MRHVSSGARELSDRIGQSSTNLNGVRVDSSQSYGNTRSEGVCSPPELKVDLVGFDIPLTELKIKLLDDKESQHLVLCAPGGCGRTILAAALCRDRDVKEKFKSNIFFITVPKLHSLLVIVNRLFQHNNCTLPESQSEEDAANHLERLFRQIGPEPILLVLVDVLPGSESLLHKLKFRIENYKILVTSRNEFPSFGSTYKLKTFNFADSMTLFQKLAFPPDEQSYTPDPHIVEEMVKYCGGFPYVISVLGKSLCRKSGAVWRMRLMECSKAGIFLSGSGHLDWLRIIEEALNCEVVAKERYVDRGTFAGQNLNRKRIEHLDTQSPEVVRPDFSTAQSSRDNFRIDIPIRSAPTSPFASPVRGPPPGAAVPFPSVAVPLALPN